MRTLRVVLIAIVALTITGCTKNMPYAKNPSASQQQETPSEEFRAAFAIFTNGTFRIFTDTKYHNKSKEVFIKAGNPNIINVKNAQVTWGDFFETLPMELSPECLTTGTGQKFCTNETASLRFFINGQQDQSALEKIINPSDKLLVTFGLKNSQVENELQAIPEP